MKKTLLLSIIIAFCFTAKAQTDSIQLAKNIIEAITSEKLENIQNLVAPPSVYREVFPEQINGANNEEIEAETSKSEKLKADFENILEAAKAKKVNLSKLSFKAVETELMMPNVYGTTITFSVGEKIGKIAVSALKHKGNWYLMEILLTSRAFRDF